MTIREKMEQALKTCNIVFADLLFDEPQTPPYALFYDDDTRNVSSDFETLEQCSDMILELYYRKRTDRARFESALMASEVVWERTQTDDYIDSESVFMSTYEVKDYEY